VARDCCRGGHLRGDCQRYWNRNLDMEECEPMSRLAKARFKSLSELPDEEFCCDEMARIAKAEIARREIIFVDLDDIQDYSGKGHCGQKLPYGKAVRAGNGELIPLEMLDLDEGPLEPIQIQAGD